MHSCSLIAYTQTSIAKGPLVMFISSFLVTLVVKCFNKFVGDKVRMIYSMYLSCTVFQGTTFLWICQKWVNYHGWPYRVDDTATSEYAAPLANYIPQVTTKWLLRKQWLWEIYFGIRANCISNPNHYLTTDNPQNICKGVTTTTQYMCFW